MTIEITDTEQTVLDVARNMSKDVNELRTVLHAIGLMSHQGHHDLMRRAIAHTDAFERGLHLIEGRINGEAATRKDWLETEYRQEQMYSEQEEAIGDETP